ncbi:MAG: CoA-binding protein [candidate division Zixibacteria bacterium]|nr:CoA-binding protein [candidate division Zixibacteria bacterium]
MQKAAENSNVAVLGASPKEDRYSFKAVKMLKENGHKPIPIHPAGHTVDGVDGLKSLSDITVNVDTLTVYVNSSISAQAYDEIIKLKPRRVIFNPGAENKELADKLNIDGIETIEACTLVMLRTKQF